MRATTASTGTDGSSGSSTADRTIEPRVVRGPGRRSPERCLTYVHQFGYSRCSSPLHFPLLERRRSIRCARRLPAREGGGVGAGSGRRFGVTGASGRRSWPPGAGPGPGSGSGPGSGPGWRSDRAPRGRGGCARPPRSVGPPRRRGGGSGGGDAARDRPPRGLLRPAGSQRSCPRDRFGVGCFVGRGVAGPPGRDAHRRRPRRDRSRRAHRPPHPHGCGVARPGRSPPERRAPSSAPGSKATTTSSPPASRSCSSWPGPAT